MLTSLVENTHTRAPQGKKINKIMLRDDSGDIPVQIKSKDFSSIFPVENLSDLTDRVADLCGFTDTDTDAIVSSVNPRVERSS